jgi:hypothetical protein
MSSPQRERPSGFIYESRVGSEIFATRFELNFDLKSTLDSLSAAERALQFLTNFAGVDRENLKLEGSSPKSIGRSVAGQPKQQRVWGYTVGFQNTCRGIPIAGDRVLIDFSGDQVARCVIRRLIESEGTASAPDAPVMDPSMLLAEWKSKHVLGKSLRSSAKFEAPTLLLVARDAVKKGADWNTARGGIYVPSWRFTFEPDSTLGEAPPRKYLWFHATTGEFLGETSL